MANETGSLNPASETGSLAYPGGGGGSSAIEVPIGLMTPPNPTARFPLLKGGVFPRRAWSPELYAQAVLAEFASSGWQAAPLERHNDEVSALAEEIDRLIDMARLRSDMRQEIVTQARAAGLYWADMLMVNQTSRPATWDLITVADTVGRLVAMHFKQKFGRARPVQVYPSLMPMLLTPPHPSYPNAHALQAALITRCIVSAAPMLDSTVGTNLAHSMSDESGTAHGPLVALMYRVGRNREIAGLHFPSDTDASFRLAPFIMNYLEAGPLFNALVAEAKEEWQGVMAVQFLGHT